MDDMGDRIRMLRKAKGWTQEQLGGEVGVSREAVSQWEIGPTKNIKNRTFARLVRALGTTQDYLLFGPDDRADRIGKRRPAGGTDSTA